MKNIIVGSLTALIIGLMIFTAMDDAVFQGGEHAKVIEDFGDKASNAAVVATPKEKTDRDKENDKINALVMREHLKSLKSIKVNVHHVMV